VLVADRTRELALVSSTDPLTGAWNRRHFYAQIGTWLRQSQAGELLLLLVDIDFFKQINDQYGHAGGDQVLVAVARRLRQVEDDGVELIRWGGEEFLLVLTSSHSSCVAAEDRAQAALRVVSELPVPVNGVEVQVRCSIGYASCRAPLAADDGEYIDRVLGRADDALYRAKREGRDRAVAASSEDQSVA
jgi:diguanylate cyclase (GGDEF)-like protein